MTKTNNISITINKSAKALALLFFFLAFSATAQVITKADTTAIKIGEELRVSFEIQADYDLNLMKPSQTLTSITSDILTQIQAVFDDYKPELILVHGDTTTTLATSLAAYYNKIPVGHIEAGLRTHDVYSPWPEELNRQVTSRIAQLHFAPTQKAANNLIEEGINKDRIFITGNTVIDALMLKVKELKNNLLLYLQRHAELIKAGYTVQSHKKYILITGHRRENFGLGFRQICHAIKQLALKNPHIDFVYPVHLNPSVQEPVHELLSDSPNIFLITPLKYEAFLYLMMNCYLVMTDSGGIQEEAPSLGKPVLVMRDTTERPEAVNAGTVKLVGANSKKIVDEAQTLINSPIQYKRMSRAHNPYGDGTASSKTLNILIEKTKNQELFLCAK